MVDKKLDSFILKIPQIPIDLPFELTSILVKLNFVTNINKAQFYDHWLINAFPYVI